MTNWTKCKSDFLIWVTDVSLPMIISLPVNSIFWYYSAPWLTNDFIGCPYPTKSYIKVGKHVESWGTKLSIWVLLPNLGITFWQLFDAIDAINRKLKSSKSVSVPTYTLREIQELHNLKHNTIDSTRMQPWPTTTPYGHGSTRSGTIPVPMHCTYW